MAEYDEYNIQFDTSIIPDFERRLAYWKAERMETGDDMPPESDLEIILSEELEMMADFIQTVADDPEMPAKGMYDLLGALRKLVDEKIPGGLKALDAHVERRGAEAKAAYEARLARKKERDPWLSGRGPDGRARALS